jgi:hypothetical protein
MKHPFAIKCPPFALQSQVGGRNYKYNYISRPEKNKSIVGT